MASVGKAKEALKGRAAKIAEAERKAVSPSKKAAKKPAAKKKSSLNIDELRNRALAKQKKEKAKQKAKDLGAERKALQAKLAKMRKKKK